MYPFYIRATKLAFLLFSAVLTLPCFAQESPFQGSGLLELECATVGENLLQSPTSGASRGIAVSAGATVDADGPNDDGDIQVPASDYISVDLTGVQSAGFYNAYLRVAPDVEDVYVRLGDEFWSLGGVDNDAAAAGDGWRWLRIVMNDPLPASIDIAFAGAGDAIDQLFYEPTGGPADLDNIYPNEVEGSNCPDFNNQAPVAKLILDGDTDGGDRERYVPFDALLNGEGSIDPDGGPISYYFSPGGNSDDFNPIVNREINEEGDFTLGHIVFDFYGARGDDFQRYRGIPRIDHDDRNNFKFLANCAQFDDDFTLRSNNGTTAVYADNAAGADGPPSDDATNQLKFTIPFVPPSQAGTYYLSGSFADDSPENVDCLYLRINGGSWVKWDILDPGLSFFPLFGIDVVAGTNTVEVAYCSPLLGIEEINLTSGTTFMRETGEPIDFTTFDCGVLLAQSGWLDAECAEYGDNWRPLGDANAGNGAFVVQKGLNSLATPPADEPGNLIKFTLDNLTVPAGTPIYLRARIDAPNGDDDSFWVRLNGGEWYAWRSGIQQGRGFQWNTYPAPLIASAGTNVLEFAYREDGTRLDRIYYSIFDELGEDMPAVGDNCPAPGGTVALEAECGRADMGWRQAIDMAASNERYFTFIGRSNMMRPVGNSNESIDYFVGGLTGGSYQLSLRMNARTVGTNSVWVRVDNEPWVKMWQDVGGGPLLTDGFEWRKVNESGQLVTFDLAPGNHIISIANRESGTQIDKLQLSLDDGVPTGFGVAARNCITAPPVAAFAVPSDRTAASVQDVAAPVSLFPNPAGDRLEVRWTDDFTGHIDLTVFDVNGRRVRDLAFDKPYGEFNTQLDVSDLPGGIYRLQLVSGDRQTVQSFVKAK